jgi:hypothetical protein
MNSTSRSHSSIFNIMLKHIKDMWRRRKALRDRPKKQIWCSWITYLREVESRSMSNIGWRSQFHSPLWDLGFRPDPTESQPMSQVSLIISGHLAFRDSEKRRESPGDPGIFVGMYHCPSYGAYRISFKKCQRRRYRIADLMLRGVR